MDNKEKVLNHLNDNNGYITTSEFINLGLSKTTLRNYVDQGFLEKLCNGVYMNPKLLPDELYVLQLKYPYAIVSHETALDIHKLTNEIVPNIHITIPAGKSIRSNQNVVVHYMTEKKYNLGIIEKVDNFGNKIKVYDPEKTICDYLKQNNDLEQQNRTLNYYFKRKDKDVSKLLEYAKVLNIYDKVNTIAEIMMKW